MKEIEGLINGKEGKINSISTITLAKPLLTSLGKSITSHVSFNATTLNQYPSIHTTHI
jgi:hypothetical protein